MDMSGGQEEERKTNSKEPIQDEEKKKKAAVIRRSSKSSVGKGKAEPLSNRKRTGTNSITDPILPYKPKKVTSAVTLTSPKHSLSMGVTPSTRIPEKRFIPLNP